MSGVERDRRTISKALFGHSYMLEVCASMPSPGERITLGDLADAIGVNASQCSAPVHRLREAGLLTLDLESDSRRKRWYRVAPSSLWSTAQELLR